MDSYIFVHNGSYTTVSGNYHNVSYIVNNLGETIEDYSDGKYILLNDEQLTFLKEHPTASPEEVITLSESDTATEADRQSVVKSIIDYDSSDNVNTFYVNGQAVWFDNRKRISLSNAISKEKEAGKETTILWIKGIPYTVVIRVAEQIIQDLELYAIACYNNTQINIALVQDMTLRSELKNFDITQGYPDKLNFNL